MSDVSTNNWSFASWRSWAPRPQYAYITNSTIFQFSSSVTFPVNILSWPHAVDKLATHQFFWALLLQVRVYLLQCQSHTILAALYNLGSGSWSAWANDTAAHYAAIHCPRWRTIGPAVRHTDIPPPPINALGLQPVARKLLLISCPAEGRRLKHSRLAVCSRLLAKDHIKVMSPNPLPLDHWYP